MIKFEFNKLIRNKIIERMPAEGVVINSSSLTHAEYFLKLKEKLVEEASEVQQASSVEEIIIELADTLEVIYTLASAYKINLQDIEQARARKAEINSILKPTGYINYVEVEDNNSKVIDYLTSRNRNYKLEV